MKGPPPLTLSKEAELRLRELFENIRTREGWANARDALSMADQIVDRHTIRRLRENKTADATVQPADVDEALEQMLLRPRASSPPPVPFPPSFYGSMPPAPPPAQAQHKHTHQHTHQHQVQQAGASEEKGEAEAAAAEAAEWQLEFPEVFRQRLGEALQKRGIVTEEAVEALVSAPLPAEIVEELGEELQQFVPQWQAKWKEKKEERKRVIEEQRKMKRVPLYRCLVCGRSGCSFMPAIDGYREVLV